MQKILLAQAKAGMILARDVATLEGRVLCGKGTELSASLLDRLARMEIVTLTVEGHPVEEGGERTLEEKIAAIERRFSKVNRIPPLAYLKKRLVHKMVRESKKMGGGKTGTPSPATSNAPQENEAGSP